MAASMKEKCLSVLDQIENILELKETPNFAAEAAHFRERLEDNEFRISVVGEFSSGKSTFINAILGQDVLQHATTETTATITRIVNTSPNDKRCRTGLVYFRNGKTIPLQDFKSLKEYTTTASQNYQVAEEVVSVDLYLPVLDAKRPIVLIDTPGLNGMADGHRSQTIQLIQRSHACIYLLQRRGLTDSDVQTLKYLCSIQKNFIFVQNFIDELQQSEGEWPNYMSRSESYRNRYFWIQKMYITLYAAFLHFLHWFHRITRSKNFMQIPPIHFLRRNVKSCIPVLTLRSSEISCRIHSRIQH